MSEFDVHEVAFAADLVNYLGDEDAVTVDTLGAARSLPAIVGRLRVEEITLLRGNVEETSYRDVCQVSIAAPPGTVTLKSRLKVARYTTGDKDTHDRQVFHVRTIDSMTDGWTTAQVWRESLAKVQQRNVEVAAR